DILSGISKDLSRLLRRLSLYRNRKFDISEAGLSHQIDRLCRNIRLLLDFKCPGKEYKGSGLDNVLGYLQFITGKMRAFLTAIDPKDVLVYEYDPSGGVISAGCEELSTPFEAEGKENVRISYNSCDRLLSLMNRRDFTTGIEREVRLIKPGTDSFPHFSSEKEKNIIDLKEVMDFNILYYELTGRKSVILVPEVSYMHMNAFFVSTVNNSFPNFVAAEDAEIYNDDMADNLYCICDSADKKRSEAYTGFQKSVFLSDNERFSLENLIKSSKVKRSDLNETDEHTEGIFIIRGLSDISDFFRKYLYGRLNRLYFPDNMEPWFLRATDMEYEIYIYKKEE
ncbi:MAG: hypothetical protein ACOCWO_06010, partial [Candidatus Muiribacteriaceae bacterium]